MDFTPIVTAQKQYYNTGITKTYTHRINALESLKEAIVKHEPEIYEALYQDLGKSKEEVFLTELGLVLSEITYAIKHLKKWMKPKKVHTPLVLFKASSKIYRDPLGTVLILSPWNYPFQLAINPLVGAIAAGNTAIVKPSSSSEKTALVIDKMIRSIFKQEFVTVVLGSSVLAEQLLHQKVDHIFFTGSIPIGKKVMQIASNNLVPVTLELGGKSPCIIDSETNLQMAAKRVAFGKLINAGQTCIAPDYVLIKSELKKDFVRYFHEAVISFYGESPIDSPHYPKIVSPRHVERLLGLTENENIVLGGKSNGFKIEPTILSDITFESKVMQEEIFGPILPLIEYNQIDEVIEILKHKEKPLAFYLFTNNKSLENKVISSLSFGGGTINDTLMHFANHHLGFGGVGHSGMGNYHGIRSYNTFTHEKSVLKRSIMIDLPLRYLPISKRTDSLIRKILK
ncbi:aldehyde dehydrogenase [Acholeplasma vituli]|uniref:Aldehyde dehydrogenase n=1 Tax=Paracholeplasma vituli TaxID=69473 RepID=A0ABT2PX08_9MOLU|nr:aldehyde dehydrogenase [Paracholeplasma vituli]MCU0105490.1 aldehyde dehydrogenase [Paracholeplasma vituli]